jgi:hypothetical protein
VDSAQVEEKGEGEEKMKRFARAFSRLRARTMRIAGGDTKNERNLHYVEFE